MRVRLHAELAVAADQLAPQVAPVGRALGLLGRHPHDGDLVPVRAVLQSGGVALGCGSGEMGGSQSVTGLSSLPLGLAIIWRRALLTPLPRSMLMHVCIIKHFILLPPLARPAKLAFVIYMV